jgi:TIR domain
MPARDLFISHSSGDAEVARALRAILDEAGYTSWMAPDDIVGTGTWTEQILAAIADSKAMLILVSAASNKSQHVSREVNLALGKGRPVLPIRIEDVAPGGSLEYLLSLLQRVDAFPPPMAVHRDRILRQIDTIIERPRPTGSSTAATAPTSTPDPTPAQPVGLSAPSAVPESAGEISVLGGKMHIPGKDGKPGVVIDWPPHQATAKGRSGPPVALLVGGGLAAVALAAVLGATLLNPGSSSGPSQVVAASPTGIATGNPTEPAMSLSPTAAPLSAAEVALQSILPVGAADPSGCTTWPTPPGGEDVLSPNGYAASSARLRCPGPKAGAAPTEFALYPTKAALDADYDSIMTSAGVAAGGACVTAIPANAPWNFPTFPESGNLACFERNGGVQYVWTQNELRVLGQWLAPDNASGFAFWQSWSQTFNPAELDLMAALPASVDDLGPCFRAADRYYEAALAIVSCPRPAGDVAVFYALFPEPVDFPNDVLTSNFDSVMTTGGFPENTTVGCYDEVPAFGRYTWGYKTGEIVGDIEGYLGCYERTDTTPTTVQFVWTFNREAVLGLWSAPNIEAGIDFFDDWITELR